MTVPWGNSARTWIVWGDHGDEFGERSATEMAAQVSSPTGTEDSAIVQRSCDAADPDTFWRIEKRRVNVVLNHRLSGRCLSHEPDVVVAADEGSSYLCQQESAWQFFEFAR